MAPKVFISYSWQDGNVHKQWVKRFATRLRTDGGLDVILDRWHLLPGDPVPQFMERAIRESDFVLAVCTPGYKKRSDERRGSIGFEVNTSTAEIWQFGNHRKFIPLLRKGRSSKSLPSWLQGAYHLDFRGDPYPELSYKNLIRTLHGEIELPPAVGRRPRFYRESGSNALPRRVASSLDMSRTPHYRPKAELRKYPLPVQRLDDTQKSRWGGKEQADGRQLLAYVLKHDEEQYEVTLRVTSLDDSALRGPVRFHLHDGEEGGFPRSIITIRRCNPDAVLEELIAYEAFTVGVEVDRSDGERTVLEADLSKAFMRADAIWKRG